MVSIVNDAVEATRPHLQSSAHELTVILPRKAVYVHGDPTRLAQAVGNVLNNACKFTVHGGRIWLAVESEGEQVVVRVRDTDQGVAPELNPAGGRRRGAGTLLAAISSNG